jgi:hypothetical protein
MHAWKITWYGWPIDRHFHKAGGRRLVVAFKEDTAARKVNGGPSAHVHKTLSAEKLPLEL